MGCEMSGLKLEGNLGIYWKVLWKHPFCCWVYLVVVKGDFLFGGGAFAKFAIVWILIGISISFSFTKQQETKLENLTTTR